MINTIERSREQLGLPKKAILLSFDDGPVGFDQTTRLLDVLKAHDVRAAFCLVGNRLLTAPAECHRILADGHLIGNHTHSHTSPYALTAEALRLDIERADATLSEVLSRSFATGYFRPPGGMLSSSVCQALNQADKRVLPITYFAWDTFHTPRLEQILPRQLLWHAIRHEGGIYLLHEAILPLLGREWIKPPDRSWIPEAVDWFLDRAKARGFAFPEPQELLHRADSRIRAMV